MNATHGTATSIPKTTGLRPRHRTIRAGYAVWLLLAVVTGLLHLQQVPASATGDEICTLEIDGSLSCPSDPTGPAPTYPPPDLLNPRILAEASVAHAESLRRLEARAIDLTIEQHGLPAGDRDAVRSWARDDATAMLWGLLMQAIKTPEAQRNIDQVNAVDWLEGLSHRQTQAAANHAGAEYARYAGIDVGEYWRRIGGTEEELRSFLSKEPVNYNGWTKEDSTGGYCKYRSPAPFEAEYTGHTVQQCNYPCMYCTPPTPSFDQFVKWGQAASARETTGAGFGMSAMAIALAGTLAFMIAGGAAAAGTAAAIVAGATGAYGIALGVALGWASATVAVEGAVVSTVMGGAAAAAGSVVALYLIIVLIVIVGIATTIMASIGMSDRLALPGKLAHLVVGARTQNEDAAALIATNEGLTKLFSLFVSATLEPRLNQMCDNSMIPMSVYGRTDISGVAVNDPETGRIALVNPNPCQNPPAIPPAGSSDPHFVLTAYGVPGEYRLPSVDVPVPHTGGTTATVRVSDNWFVYRLAAGTTPAETKSLWLPYTDWEGKVRYATVIKEPNGAYTFSGVYEETLTAGGLNRDTCVSDGTCWTDTRLEYVGSDGRKYVARLVS